MLLAICQSLATRNIMLQAVKVATKVRLSSMTSFCSKITEQVCIRFVVQNALGHRSRRILIFNVSDLYM